MTVVVAPTLGHNAAFTQLGVGTTPGFDAIDLRRSDSMGWQEGIGSTTGTDYSVIQRAAGANMTTDINSNVGYMMVQGDTVTQQGLYYVPPHGSVINEGITPADPTNPRIDQVVLEVKDTTHDGSGSNLAQTRVIAGTPTGGATLANRSGAAALPNTCCRLADVLVGAGVTSILTANIRDRRSWARGFFSRQVKTNASPTNATTTLAAIDTATLQVRGELSGVPLRLILNCVAFNNTAGDGAQTGCFIDGAGVDSTTSLAEEVAAGTAQPCSPDYSYVTVPSAGSHLFAPTFASVTGGTTTMNGSAGIPCVFIVEELVRSNSNNGTA